MLSICSLNYPWPLYCIKNSFINNSLVSMTLFLENFLFSPKIPLRPGLCSQVLLDKLLESLVLESLNILYLKFSMLDIAWHPPLFEVFNA